MEFTPTCIVHIEVWVSPCPSQMYVTSAKSTCPPGIRLEDINLLTVLFVSISQVIGCEDRLRNDLYCLEWGVKLYSNSNQLNSELANTHISDSDPNWNLDSYSNLDALCFLCNSRLLRSVVLQHNGLFTQTHYRFTTHRNYLWIVILKRAARYRIYEMC